MTNQKALNILKRKLTGSHEDAAKYIARRIERLPENAMPNKDIVSHLLEWQLGDNETITSIRKDFNEWRREYGTYAVLEN